MAAFEEQEYNKPFSFRTWAKMLPFFKPYRKYFAITLGLNIVLAGIDVIVPLFQSYAIDRFITRDTLQGLGVFAAVYAAVIVAQTCSVYWSVRAATIIEMNVGKDLKWAQFTHLQTLSFSYYNTTPVGYIHARVMSDTLRIATMVAWGLVDMFWAFLYVVSVFGIMFMLNARLALILLVIVPCIAVLTVYFQNKILHWNRKVRKINSQITSAYNEGITGVRTSKSMGIEKDNEEAFFRRTADMQRAAGRSAKLNAIYIPTILLFSSVAAAIVLAQGGYMVKEDIMRLGTLSVFISYAVIIFEPIQQLARLLAELISCQANIERVMDLLEQEPNVVDTKEVVERYGDTFHPKKENWEKIKGDIVFEDVSFMYPDGKEYVLEHFNLHVPAGMNVAIVGETGAGKSTLVNLIPRFYDVTEGKIMIDGTDIRDITQHELREKLGYVPQKGVLFSGTIKSNILYGNKDGTEEEMLEAAQVAQASGFIEEKPEGYESHIAQGGSNVSGGQKQRLSIARAIARHPDVFIFDDSFSALDYKTDRILRRALDQECSDITRIIVAQRIGTIREADRIIVLNEGRIAGIGRHEELMKNCEVYQQIALSQLSQEELA